MPTPPNYALLHLNQNSLYNQLVLVKGILLQTDHESHEKNWALRSEVNYLHLKSILNYILFLHNFPSIPNYLRYSYDRVNFNNKLLSSETLIEVSSCLFSQGAD